MGGIVKLRERARRLREGARRSFEVGGEEL